MFIVVPFEMNISKESGRTVSGNFLVVGNEHVFHMEMIFFTDIFDEEIFDGTSKVMGIHA